MLCAWVIARAWLCLQGAKFRALHSTLLCTIQSVKLIPKASGACNGREMLHGTLGRRHGISACETADCLGNRARIRTHSRTHVRARIRTHARGRSIRDSLRIPVGLTARTRTRARNALFITPEQCRPRRHCSVAQDDTNRNIKQQKSKPKYRTERRMNRCRVLIVL